MQRFIKAVGAGPIEAQLRDLVDEDDSLIAMQHFNGGSEPELEGLGTGRVASLAIVIGRSIAAQSALDIAKASAIESHRVFDAV